LPKQRETLDQLRMAAGYTQKQIAQQAGIAWITIARLELGEHKPKPATLSKLASVLGNEVYHARYGWRKKYVKRGRPRQEDKNE
jgi:transcriptional regulator with XRE-family HTH domain